MLYKWLLISMIITFGCKNDNTLTSNEVLDMAINYHDSDNQWPTMDASFEVQTIYPDSSMRLSSIKLSLPDDAFQLRMERDSTVIYYKLVKDSCVIGINGDLKPSKSLADSLSVSCERAKMYKDYYTYLYGLPMKLKDPGTILNDTVKTVRFNNKEYLQLNASYKADVGSDLWYFYFDPETYAMEAYQFFKTDELGHKIEDSGEYIVLSGEESINGIRIPKTRKWYYNNTHQYLGTDILIKNTSQAQN